MSTVVLYYQNQQLTKLNQDLQTQLSSKKEHNITAFTSVKKQEESNISAKLIDLQNKLQECQASTASKPILYLTPVEEKKKDFNSYLKSKDFVSIKPYNNDDNISKKHALEVMPDVIFDKKKEDIGLRLELKKQF